MAILPVVPPKDLQGSWTLAMKDSPMEHVLLSVVATLAREEWMRWPHLGGCCKQEDLMRILREEPSRAFDRLVDDIAMASQHGARDKELLEEGGVCILH